MRKWVDIFKACIASKIAPCKRVVLDFSACLFFFLQNYACTPQYCYKHWKILRHYGQYTRYRKVFFLLFGVSAKMYIPSTIKTQIMILMTGANNNGGSWVIWRHGKIICYCLGPWYMNIVPSFFCADLGLQGRTAIFLKVSYFWELDFLHCTQS